MRIYRNRREAGHVLASLLDQYAGREDVLVLGLARGGVPVAFEVARSLGAPLDVFVVRKLGAPGNEELAMGAVASGGIRILNRSVIDSFAIPAGVIDRVAAEERRELELREQIYRGDRPFPEVRGKTVILVDDGLATGSTMLAAVAALRRRGPSRIVVAVPTAPADTCSEFSQEVDECVCADLPERFHSVGQSYADFPQTCDGEVTSLLARAAKGLVAA